MYAMTIPQAPTLLYSSVFAFYKAFLCSVAHQLTFYFPCRVNLLPNPKDGSLYAFSSNGERLEVCRESEYPILQNS